MANAGQCPFKSCLEKVNILAYYSPDSYVWQGGDGTEGSMNGVNESYNETGAEVQVKHVNSGDGNTEIYFPDRTPRTW